MCREDGRSTFKELMNDENERRWKLMKIDNMKLEGLVKMK